MTFVRIFFLFVLSFNVLKAEYQPTIEDEILCNAPCEEFCSPVFLSNCPIECEKPWSLDVRVAYYRPQSKHVRKIYGDAWADFQVEASRKIFDYANIWCGVSWTGKEHGRSSPFRKGFEDKTKLFLLPLSIGCSFIYPILPCTELYLGAGACYSFLEIRSRFEEDDYSYSSYSSHSSSSSSTPLVDTPAAATEKSALSSFDDKKYFYSSCSHKGYKHTSHRSAWGGIFKVGIHYKLNRSTFIDVFADYYLQRFKFSDRDYSRNLHIFRKHIDCSGYKIGAGLGVYF